MALRRDDPEPPPGALPGDSRLWAPEVLITDDGSPALWSPRYGQAFRSRHGAHLEARHVFLEGSGTAARLVAGHATRVLEVGLGTATNLTCTAAAAIAAGTPLRYCAWEPEPLPSDALRLAGLGALAPQAFVEALLAARDAWGQLTTGDVRCWRHGPLDLVVVVAPIGRLHDSSFATEVDRRQGADAIYLDPFSPEANPEPWSPAVLTTLAERLAPGGTLVSYSVRGDVRRTLAAAGLQVRKVAGPPGGKREVLHAVRPTAGGTPPTGGTP